jgi:hypothetical protein
MIILQKTGRDAVGGKRFILVRLHKKAARIPDSLWFYQNNFWDG